MERFVLNQNVQANGDYEVHNVTTGCTYMPQPQNQIDLGYHASCHGEVAEAKSKWPTARINGCFWCCPACHTS